CEDKSVNTYQNMLFSKRVMDRHGGCKPAFATTNYHVFRGYVLAQKVGMQDAQGISAKTKWYFYPNAFLRELVGLIVDKKWKHIIFLTLLSAAEFGLSYLSFIG
ncbi:MAG: YdcF family protein, partial [Ruminococcus sp.]|nr:YdcF family protein [Ruminococcus sp.]